MSKQLDHHFFMQQAFKQALIAYDTGEVPVGAVIVHQNRIIAKGHNQMELLTDPTAHAEMIALSSAFQFFGEKYLPSCTMYVTLEPCPMCAGALVWSKIGKLVIAAQDERAGACGSIFNIANNDHLNHQIETVYGIMEHDSQIILKNFFSELRKKPPDKN